MSYQEAVSYTHLMTYQPQGLILVTGKTNSGKSTTLNSLIDYINENQNKMCIRDSYYNNSR